MIKENAQSNSYKKYKEQSSVKEFKETLHQKPIHQICDF